MITPTLHRGGWEGYKTNNSKPATKAGLLFTRTVLLSYTDKSLPLVQQQHHDKFELNF